MLCKSWAGEADRFLTWGGDFKSGDRLLKACFGQKQTGAGVVHWMTYSFFVPLENHIFNEIALRPGIGPAG